MPGSDPSIEARFCRGARAIGFLAVRGYWESRYVRSTAGIGAEPPELDGERSHCTLENRGRTISRNGASTRRLIARLSERNRLSPTRRSRTMLAIIRPESVEYIADAARLVAA